MISYHYFCESRTTNESLEVIAQLEACLFLAPKATLAVSPEPGKTALAQVLVQLRCTSNYFRAFATR